MKKFGVTSWELGDRTRTAARRVLAGRRLRHRSSFPTPHAPLPTASAFTLVELLVVLTIISIVVAIGIPLFGVLTGAKSVEAGRNVVAATIGAARTAAVNEGKYAGVLFYVDPATERTAMSVVIVSDPVSGLEDADPYDKYKGWVEGEQYYSAGINAGGVPVRGDRAIGVASDADATFKGTVYSGGLSENGKYFGNYRPTVRAYRCTEENTASNGNAPPRVGPYGTYAGSAPQPPQYGTLPALATGMAPASSSTEGPFANQYWDAATEKALTRYSTGEQTLLPLGIGLQVIVEPIVAGGNITDRERYLRTAVIMFDPQGRLVQRSFQLSNKVEAGRDVDPADLGSYLRLDGNANDIAAGVGVVLYDSTKFKSQTGFSEADYTYRPGGPRSIRSISVPVTLNPSLADYPSASFAEEKVEELWLDNNTTPILINRYSGSMSDAN